MNPFDVSQKHFLITGGSSGIGRATVDLAIQLGANVTVLGRNKEALEVLKDKHGNAFEFHIIDLHNFDELDTFLEYATSSLFPVHGLLHSAGISPTVPFSREKTSNLRTTMEVNVYAGLAIARWLIKNHRKTLESIVYISSVMAQLGEKAKSTYSLSKSALEGSARVQALELAKHKIRVNTIAPAVINTPLSEKSIYRQSKDALQSILDKHPLGLGEPNDVANTAIFLLSDASRWITGSTLTVDGGYSAQ
jgi:NAD(P)-dependent dehydrogenase (short-subunit alcohol dehydrogenase family)